MGCRSSKPTAALRQAQRGPQGERRGRGGLPSGGSGGAVVADTPPGRGVFSAQMIRRAIADGVIKSALTIEDEQIQPASLDLRLGDRAYRLRSSFLPGGARV